MTTRRGLATIAVVLLIIVAGYAVLYAVRSQVPATTAPLPSPIATQPVAPSPSQSPSAPTPTPTPTRTATPATAGHFKWPCGTVTAYVAPTATAAGSVSLGTSTFALARGSGPTNNASLSGSLCVNGDQDVAGVFTQFSVSPMGEGICSVVTAYAPASATAPGSLDFGTPKPPVTIPVAAGVTFSPAQVTGDQCFRVTPDAQGTAQVTAYIGPRR